MLYKIKTRAREDFQYNYMFEPPKDGSILDEIGRRCPMYLILGIYSN